MNFVVPNTVKRVLHIIREACKELRLETELPAEEGVINIERKKSAKQAADDFALFELNLTMLNEKGSSNKLLSRRTFVNRPQSSLSKSMSLDGKSISTSMDISEKMLKK